MNLVSIYLEKNILSNTVKKNQWYSIKNVVKNYGSKSLHSFWATLYSYPGNALPDTHTQVISPLCTTAHQYHPSMQV